MLRPTSQSIQTSGSFERISASLCRVFGFDNRAAILFQFRGLKNQDIILFMHGGDGQELTAGERSGD